ncbi:hypothetical protein YC2023_082360 [Brassica napus]
MEVSLKESKSAYIARSLTKIGHASMNQALMVVATKTCSLLFDLYPRIIYEASLNGCSHQVNTALIAQESEPEVDFASLVEIASGTIHHFSHDHDLMRLQANSEEKSGRHPYMKPGHKIKVNGLEIQIVSNNVVSRQPCHTCQCICEDKVPFEIGQYRRNSDGLLYIRRNSIGKSSENTTILSENATIRSENATILAELASQKKFNTEIMQKLDRLMSSSSS